MSRLLSGILVCLLLRSCLVLVEAQPSPDKTLYLLSFLTYPDNATNSPVDEGSRYAIDLINSESIIPGYKLDLIEASDGCDSGWNGVANMVRSLYYSDKKVIAIVGPQCSGVAKVVGSLLGLPQVSLLNIHLASSHALSNRTRYPYSFGMNTPTFLTIGAFAALIDRNGWSRVGILYDPSIPIYFDSYLVFLNAMKNKTVEFAFTSYVSLDYIYVPLAGLKDTYVRVIFSFLARKLQEKVLCLAYHMNMTYPRYQWILGDSTTAFPLRNVSIVYKDIKYTCDPDQMASALNRSVFAGIEKLESQDTMASVPGISNYDRFEKCSDSGLVNCVLTFDATLALALALNNSILPLLERNLSLSDYTSSQQSFITSIIQQEIMKLSFVGMSGTIVQFDPNSGYPSAVTTYLLQYFEESNISSTFGKGMIFATTMLNGTLNFEDIAVAFVSTDFDRIHTTPPTPLATVVVTIGVAVPLVVLVGIHVLNTAYSNVPSIKASSSNLNHFAYVGCYFILFAEVVYTSGELASFDIRAKTVLCNVFPWCLILGLTLVFSTVCVKTGRLYFIFTNSVNGKANNRLVVKLKDNLLASIIVGLVLTSAVLLTAWTWSHPLVRYAKNSTVPSGDTVVILNEEFCDSENQGYWFAAVIIFETILLASCVELAFLNRNVKMKDFQTHSVILLAYLLTLTSIVGVATYFFLSDIGALNLSLSYGIQCFVLSLTVYLCIFLLFLPPVWPVLKRKPGFNGNPPPKRITRQDTAISRT